MLKKQQLLACVLYCALTSPAFGVGQATQWDIRTTGSDTNGGGFDSGVASPGTDESQGAGTAVTITLATGTTGTCSPACTSTTHGPGNLIWIASGTGCNISSNTLIYEILSQSGGTITLDQSMGTASSSCVGTIGGSRLSLFPVTETSRLGNTGNTVWVQSGTYTGANNSGIVFAPAIVQTWIGYQTTHGDNGTKPLITTSTAGQEIVRTQGGTWTVKNIAFSNTAATPTNDVISFTNGGIVSFYQVSIAGGTYGVTNQTSAFVSIIACDISGSLTAGVDATGGYMQLIGNTIHGHTGNSYLISNLTYSEILHNVFYANCPACGSSTSLGDIESTYSGGSNSLFGIISNNTFFGGKGNAISTPNGQFSGELANNIFYGYNGTGNYALKIGTALGAGIETNNFFGGNTSNAFAGFTLNSTDVTGISNPFVASGSNNFSLTSGNAAANGGFPSSFPVTSTAGINIVGAVGLGAGLLSTVSGN